MTTGAIAAEAGQAVRSAGASSSQTPARSSEVDHRIAEAAAFAQPILRHLRDLVHRSCPEIDESIKWSRPMFLYRGRILCFMAAFKQHCTFGFWNPEMAEALRTAGMPVNEAGGSLGQIKHVSDLPRDEQLIAWIQQAVSLERSSQGKPRLRVTRPVLDLPTELEAALADRPGLPAQFAALTPSCQREYVTWIMEAKRPETRARRIAEAIAKVVQSEPRQSRRSL